MNIRAYVVVGVIGAFVLSGCAAEEPESGMQRSAGSETVAEETPDETAQREIEAVIAAAPTAPGETCDINSLYTVDCHKQYPEVAYLNALKRNAVEPLASMSDADKIALGQQACAQIGAGAEPKSVKLIGDAPDPETMWTSDDVIVGAAIPSFCVEFDTSGNFD